MNLSTCFGVCMCRSVKVSYPLFSRFLWYLQTTTASFDACDCDLLSSKLNNLDILMGACPTRHAGFVSQYSSSYTNLEESM